MRNGVHHRTARNAQAHEMVGSASSVNLIASFFQFKILLQSNMDHSSQLGQEPSCLETVSSYDVFFFLCLVKNRQKLLDI